MAANLIHEVHKGQNPGAGQLERIIEFEQRTQIPYDAIHKELFSHCLSKVNLNEVKPRESSESCLSASILSQRCIRIGISSITIDERCLFE